MLLSANSPDFATIALRPNGIIGPNERHHTPKLLASALFSATALHMGAGALTDCESASIGGGTGWPWSWSSWLCTLRSQPPRQPRPCRTSCTAHADPPPRVTRARGRPRLLCHGRLGVPHRGVLCTHVAGAASRCACSGVTPGRLVYERFCLPPYSRQGLGFPSPFRCAVANLPDPSSRSHASLSDPLVEYFRSRPTEWERARAVGAARVPLCVLDAAVAAGAAQLFGAVRLGYDRVDLSLAPAFLSHASARQQKTGGSADPGVLFSSSSEVLLTAELGLRDGVLRVPDAVVTAAAGAFEAGAAACLAASCGTLNLEPFLTLADSRKVLRHNYYENASAARELGIAGPVTRPSEAAREMLAAAAAAGYSGVVPSPPLGVWLAILGGLAITAMQAWDTGGLLTFMFGMWCSAASAALPDASFVTHALGCGAASARSSPAGRLIWDVYFGAFVCHALQGAIAAVLALRYGRSVLRWGVQCLLLGMPSSTPLVSSCLGSAAGAVTPVLCFSLFIGCTCAARLLY